MQFTALHWTVMLEEVTSDTLTEVGAADGATKHRNWYYACCIVGSYGILNALQVCNNTD